MRIIRMVVMLMLVLASFSPASWAQTTSPANKPGTPTEIRTFYLTNTFQADEATELTTALRNELSPENKIYLVRSQNAVVISGTHEQLELAQKLLTDLDRPKKLYRLTYTVTETDGGKTIGTQHFALVVAGGQRTTLKQGSKIPVVTGSFTAGNNSTQSQFTYLDVGLNFDATLDEFVNGVRLRTKVEQSSVADSKSSVTDPYVSSQEPIIRQTVLEGTSFLAVGKPLILGSLDIAGSTRHLDVAVVMDIVR